MLEAREIIAAIVAVVLFFLFLVNRGKLAQVPHSGLLVASFAMLAASLACSVIEVFFWKDVFDFLQHALGPACVVLLAIWSWLAFVRSEGVSA